MGNNEFLAHVRKFDREEQSLLSHLSEVAELSKTFADKIGCPMAGEIIGLLHDFGKYSQAFQAYIKSATGLINQDMDDYVDFKSLKGKIDHSSAGAQYIWKKLSTIGAKGQGRLSGQILAIAIASHHSGLIDSLNLDGENVFERRMKKAEEKAHLDESCQASDKQILDRANQLLDRPLVGELIEAIGKIEARSGSLGRKIALFERGFLLRFLFSCLIDADRLNSAEFEDESRKVARIIRVGPPTWDVAVARIEEHLKSLVPKNYVDDLRGEISNNCRSKAETQQGIFTLTVPTGGGKTYASLRFALHHARKFNLEHIFFVIPYTSIIDQNAKAIRDVVERDDDTAKWVLEHHSNLEPDQQTWQSKLVSENWDAPIVLTTMFQLLEAFFGGGTRSVRRLHHLAKSVLIFDEIQTLPVNCVHIFCNAINFLTNHCRSTVVLCTATQPLLTNLKSPQYGQLIVPNGNELAGDIERHFVDLQRVKIHNKCKIGGWNSGEITQLAMDEFRAYGSCLVIVNTKAWAKSLFQECEGRVSQDDLFHLSTYQYPAHRKSMLNEIKERLKSGAPVLCISTQLIEAGVDVDFATVIRFLAGLDSIAQAAGRCNRNGMLKDASGNKVKGNVYVLNPDKESVGMLPAIKVGKEIAERVMREDHENLLAPSAMERYFQYYFYQRADAMVYELGVKDIGRDDSLLNLLSDNPLCPRRVSPNAGGGLLSQSFMEAGKQFKAIDAPTQSVIVQHGEGYQLVTDLCSAAKEFDVRRYYQLLREAQQFSVNVFPNMWTQLIKNQAVEETQPGHGIFYLKNEFYSEAFGINVEPVQGQQFMGV